MRSVEKEWLGLTERNKAEGKSVRFYGPDGTPKFEGRIESYGWGSIHPRDRVFKWARFYGCRTLNKDLSTRKGSATEREQSIPYDWQFIFLGEDKEIPIPKTASELTDEHIGMEFTFHGTPPIRGIYEGEMPDYTHPNQLYIKVNQPNGEQWAWDSGYFIVPATKLTYIGGTGNPSGGGVDTDAKLAAYLNQELGKWMRKIGSNGEFPETQKLGQEVVRLIKEITQPTP